MNIAYYVFVGSEHVISHFPCSQCITLNMVKYMIAHQATGICRAFETSKSCFRVHTHTRFSLHRVGDGGAFVLFVATAVATCALDGPVHCLTLRGQAAAARSRVSNTTIPTPTASTTTATTTTIVVRSVVGFLLLGSALEDSIGVGGEGLALVVSWGVALFLSQGMLISLV
jgi:hypothetical protein